MTETITQYDTRHGSAYDRGSADAWSFLDHGSAISQIERV